jgi:hypothetical protein
MARRYALARVIKWEFGPAGAFDRPRTPEEIIDKLEERIGPKGRALFEDFVRKINMLQAEQQLEQQAANVPSPATIGIN